jgi:hypothetical protein
VFGAEWPSAERTMLNVQRFERLLAGGGDERIAIDAETGRNRYGAPRGMAGDEAWFSSSTATAITPRGYDAAVHAFHSVLEGHDAALPGWFDRLRARLLGLFGTPGAEVVLAGSGTELELVALAVARAVLRQPLTNLVVAPGETGRGVLLAAAGRHFLGSAPFRDRVACGELIEGFEDPETLVESVDIRDQDGMPRSADSIDDNVIRKVEASIARDRRVLIHVLDCSKTNRSGLRRSTASALMARYQGQALVVVDSCQLRGSPEQVRADLRAGFMVMVTGSKFAAGPPFAAALLLPPDILRQLRDLDLPAGLLAYTAAEDWPAALRGPVTRPFAATDNIGVGLRWEAALAELERLFALPVPFRDAVARAFADAVAAHVRDTPRLALIGEGRGDCREPVQTIWPIVTAARDDISLTSEAVHRALRLPRPDDPLPATSKRIFHVGQPVLIGPRSALRVCLSASQIVDAAETMAGQGSLETAVAPLMADVDGLFRKWMRIADELSRRG